MMCCFVLRCACAFQVHEVARSARNPDRVLSAVGLPEDAPPGARMLAKAQWWWTCRLRKPALRCAVELAM